MDSVWPYVTALVPSIGVGYLFYVIIKNVLTSDRNERLAQARWEKEQEARASSAPRGPGDDTT